MSSLFDTEEQEKILKTEEEKPSYIKEWLKKNTFHYSTFKNVKNLIAKKNEGFLKRKHPVYIFRCDPLSYYGVNNKSVVIVHKVHQSITHITLDIRGLSYHGTIWIIYNI